MFNTSITPSSLTISADVMNSNVGNPLRTSAPCCPGEVIDNREGREGEEINLAQPPMNGTD